MFFVFLIWNLKVISDYCLARMYDASYCFQEFNHPYQLKFPYFTLTDSDNRTKHMAQPTLALVSKKNTGFAICLIICGLK